MEFEFRCLRVTQDRVIESEGRALVDALNELGRKGWQLASLCAEQGHEDVYLAVLQRTVQDGNATDPERDAP